MEQVKHCHKIQTQEILGDKQPSQYNNYVIRKGKKHIEERDKGWTYRLKDTSYHPIIINRSDSNKPQGKKLRVHQGNLKAEWLFNDKRIIGNLFMSDNNDCFLKRVIFFQKYKLKFMYGWICTQMNDMI